MTLVYIGSRYHLQETARAALRPETPEELYNLRHSQRRIIVEMAIGWHKATFKILTNRPAYPVRVQNSIIFATAGLLNWMKDYGTSDAELPVDEAEWVPKLGPPATESTRGPGMQLSRSECDGTTTGDMPRFRDQIAVDMWQQYRAYRMDLAESISARVDGSNGGDDGNGYDGDGDDSDEE